MLFTTRLTLICKPFLLEPRGRAEPALVRPAPHDLSDLADHVLELLVRGEEVRTEPDPRARAEVADDLPLAELLVHRLEIGDVHGHGAAAAPRVARRAHLEACLVRE